MLTQYCYLYLTLQTARPDVWLGLLLTPAHPFSSTTQLRSGAVPDTPYSTGLGPVSAKLSKHYCITAGNKAISLVQNFSIGKHR
ncbi:hypothetical protein PoB_001790500 [Plakobranchus ocellatus]|uniref:Uncharacterized protein n=1 Tax=Plakobranchus ocellatus TaxID=259542 RepID=A0AAV3Z7B6_9GAST|nr:hypothetical protein PoB_001790500 [Plakobranchus ocellatus]